MDATFTNTGPNTLAILCNTFPEKASKLNPINDKIRRPIRKKISIFFSLNNVSSADLVVGTAGAAESIFYTIVIYFTVFTGK
jgi:hypothetical protein